MLEANVNLDTIRIFLHVLAVTVWVGGQIVMMAIVPVLKEAGVDGLPAKVAQGFQNIAWPALMIAIFTGIWNIFSIDIENASTAWNMVFGFKFLLVIISGVGAFKHAKTDDPAKKGLFGAIGFFSALLAMFLGYVI